MAYYDAIGNRLVADFYYLQIIKEELASFGISLSYISADGKQHGFEYEGKHGHATAPTLGGILDMMNEIENPLDDFNTPPKLPKPPIAIDTYYSDKDGQAVAFIDTEGLPDNEKGPICRIYLNDDQDDPLWDNTPDTPAKENTDAD